MTNEAYRLAMTVFAAALLFAACGSGTSSTGNVSITSASMAAGSTTSSLPLGVMSAAQACEHIVGRGHSSFFTHVERVHLVLTTYEKGEPTESEGDISHGMAPKTLVWVVEVHAKAIHWNHSVPAGYKAPKLPDTDFSVVMNAATGMVTDSGECRCWPLPLWKVGTLASLPANC